LRTLQKLQFSFPLEGSFPCWRTQPLFLPRGRVKIRTKEEEKKGAAAAKAGKRNLWLMLEFK
jgi:hypothetical protein